MGIMAQGKGLWNALFTRTQRQVLSLMFGHPERSYYANEVVRIAGVGTGSVQRELARLSECGLLTVRRIGNQKHFQANPDSPIYSDLRSIVLKTFGSLDQLRVSLARLEGDVSIAFMYGPQVRSVVAGADDIHILIVSDNLEYVDVVSGFTGTENRIGRTIHPLLFKIHEFESLRAERNEAVLGMLEQPRVVLLGTLD